MKQKIFTHAILLFSLGALTACPPNKSGDNPNLAPQGRVMSQDSGSYCDLNNGTLTCYGTDQNSGQRCATLSKSYNPNDRVNLCSQLYRMRSETSQGNGFMNSGFGNFGFMVCEVQGALNSAIAQHCQDVQDQWGLGETPGNPGNPGNPGGGNPMNPGLPGGDLGLAYKSFQCDFEAQRTSSGRWLNTNVNIPRTTALVTFDSRTTQRINLRSKFLGIDIGKFGELTMIYRPGQGGDESIELRNEGLKIGEERVRIVQSGSASQEVRLEALADGLYMRVACRNSASSGNGSPRSRTRAAEPAPAAALAGSESAPAAAGSGTNLVCTGQSRIVGTELEEIELVLPLNTLANGQEFQISQAVSGKLNGSSITYNAVLDRDFGPTIISTTSLRSASALKANDRAATIDVTCAVQ